MINLIVPKYSAHFMRKFSTAAIFSTCLRSSFAFLFLLTVVASAQDEPLLISNSRSPDGKLELWIKPPIQDDGEACGAAQIRQVKTERILSTFEWSGFGVHADSTAFTVLWRPDCKYFAIKYEEARGWVTGRIYGLQRNGRWCEVKLPSDDYTNSIKKLADVTELHGKGCERPKEWLSNGDLTLLFVDRGLFYDHEDLEKEFVVTLRVADQKGQPLPIAKIVSIKQQSENEAERELQAR
jgi:hypothetical protein